MFSRTSPRLGLLLALLFTVGVCAPALAQKPGGDGHHVGGRIASISGSTIAVTDREGESHTITVTAETTYEFNRTPATLADFQAGDYLGAYGDRDAQGNFVAEKVFGSDVPPPPRRPRDPHLLPGLVVSVDTAARTITVQSPRGDKTAVIYTTDTTKFARNRQPATLADFKAGDHVMAHGERDADKHFVADDVRGGDQAPN